MQAEILKLMSQKNIKSADKTDNDQMYASEDTSHLNTECFKNNSANSIAPPVQQPVSINNDCAPVIATSELSGPEIKFLSKDSDLISNSASSITLNDSSFQEAALRNGLFLDPQYYRQFQ